MSAQERSAALTGVSSINQDLLEIDAIQSKAKGPNKYVISAIGTQIKALWRLQTKIEENILASEKVVAAIKEFDEASSRSEQRMRNLTYAQVFFGLMQLVVALIALWIAGSGLVVNINLGS
jgi:hypothetical protein